MKNLVSFKGTIHNLTDEEANTIYLKHKKRTSFSSAWFIHK